MNPVKTIRAFVSRARERMDLERRGALWAACAWQMCASPSSGLASMPGSVAASALEAVTAAQGEDAMRLAMSRVVWTRPEDEAILGALAALGAPIHDGWMERMVALAPPEGFKRSTSTHTLPRHARDALKNAGLLPECASPLLWLCAATQATSEHDWAARFEIARPLLEPASPQEAAACLHLGRQARFARHGESSSFLGASSSSRKSEPLAGSDAFGAWIERWLVAQAATGPGVGPTSPGASLRL